MNGTQLEKITLSETYLKNAGEIARDQAAVAAMVLAEMLRQDVMGPTVGR